MTTTPNPCCSLGPARRALAEGDRAVEVARDPGRPLRIDVWGHLYDPMRTVGPVVAAMPGLSTEIGHSRDLPAAVTALRRAEIDMGFGRVYPVGERGQDRMASRLARLEHHIKEAAKTGSGSQLDAALDIAGELVRRAREAEQRAERAEDALLAETDMTAWSRKHAKEERDA